MDPGYGQAAVVHHTGRVRTKLTKAVFPLLILAGIGFFAAAGIFGRTGDGAPAERPGLEAVQPVNRAEAQARQVTVIADLEPGYTGTLRLNDRAIPPAQLEPDDGLNKLMFRPGEGKVVTAFSGRENCAEVTWWRIELGPSSAGAPYRWCFNVS